MVEKSMQLFAMEANWKTIKTGMVDGRKGLTQKRENVDKADRNPLTKDLMRARNFYLNVVVKEKITEEFKEVKTIHVENTGPRR